MPAAWPTVDGTPANHGPLPVGRAEEERSWNTHRASTERIAPTPR